MPFALDSIASIAVRLVGELIAPSGCAACDAPLPPRVLFCPACVASVERAQAATSQPLAMFEYGGAIATAIVRLKYGDRPDLAPRLGESILPVALSLRGKVDVVVPVPLHPRRLAERGYNQALLLARPIATSLGVPLAPCALRRIRDTPRQAALDRRGRLANMASSFRIDRSALVEGARVLLVDDVCTTGATLEACEQALRSGKSDHVVELVVARRS